MPAMRILVVDDEPLFGELLSGALAAATEIEVVGIARDGETAVRLARQALPDAILMDIELPGRLDGIDAALQIKRERPRTGIVLLSAHLDRRYFTSLPLEEGAGWSYLLKRSVPDLAAVVRAIQGSIQGLVVLDPALVTGLRPRRGSALARLTPRQRDVLELIAQGYSNAAIAQRLTLTERSVETYSSAIYQELGLTGEQDIHARVRATIIALEESESQPRRAGERSPE